MRHSHAAGREGAPGGYTTRPGRGAAARHGRSLAPSPAGTPPPAAGSAPLGHFRHANRALFPPAAARRALCLPAGRACAAAAAILRCLSPALPFGERSPPPPRGASSSAP